MNRVRCSVCMEDQEFQQLLLKDQTTIGFGEVPKIGFEQHLAILARVDIR
jgi:hypothetical protein